MAAPYSNVSNIDKSLILSANVGKSAAICFHADKGPEDAIITNVDQWIAKFGKPDPSKGSAHYHGIMLANSCNTVYARRVHNQARYAAALVRGKIVEPNLSTIPVPDHNPDKIIQPIPGGLSKEEIESFQFPLYRTNRVYESFQLPVVLASAVNTGKSFYVKNIDQLDQINVDDQLSITVGNNDSQVLTVASTEVVETNIPTIKLNIPTTVNSNTEIKYKSGNYVPFSTPVYTTVNANRGDTELHVTRLDLLTINNTVRAGSTNYTVTSFISHRDISYSTPVTLAQDTLIGDDIIKVVNASAISVGDELKIGSLYFNVLAVSNNYVTLNNPVAEILLIGTELLKRSQVSMIVLDKPLASDIVSGVEVLGRVDTVKSFDTPIFVLRSVVDRDTVFVTNNDSLSDGYTIVFGNNPTEYIIDSKSVYTEETYKVTTNETIADSHDELDEVLLLVESEFEHRDAMLIIADNAGAWGNSLSLNIRHHKLDSEIFYIDLYQDGVLLDDSFEVARSYKLDGFGRQLNLEEKINDKNDYIRVINNLEYVDADGKYPRPMKTDYSLWREIPTKNFNVVATLDEDAFYGDTELQLDISPDLELGDVIRVGTHTEEYKVIDVFTRDINGVTKYFISINSIVKQTIRKSSEISKFIDYEYKKISKLPQAYHNYPINSALTISGVQGVLLDAGNNLLTGGSNGLPITVGHLMESANEFKNTDKYNFPFICDAGYAYPAYLQKLDEICVARGFKSHAYGSVDYEAEMNSNYARAIVDFKNSTNLNSSAISLFSPHCKIYDEYNKREVWVAPSALALAAQSIVADQQEMWIAASGWTNGKLRVLGVLREFTPGERDVIHDGGVNPLRSAPGKGVSVWGNITTQTALTALQSRHVALLMIVINTALDDYLDYQTFILNTAENRARAKLAVDDFMEPIKSASGVYDYYTKCDEENNPAQKIDEKFMYVDLYIKPTRTAEYIKGRVVITATGTNFSLVEL